MIIVPKNWAEFQHYKDRSPAWIKLHRGILDDYEFSCLPVASRALAPCIWLLASEYTDGKIDASEEKLAFRLRMSVDELGAALKPLIDGGFLVLASGALAECKHVAIPEREKKEEIQEEKEGEEKERARRAWAFDEFWVLFPNKVGKGAAEKAFEKAAKNPSIEFPALLAALGKYTAKTDDRPWCNPATWLNQSRWTDEPAEVKNGKSLMGAIDRFDENYAKMRASLALDEDQNIVRLIPPRPISEPGRLPGPSRDYSSGIRPADRGDSHITIDGDSTEIEIPAHHRGTG